MSELTQARLKEVLKYNKRTGAFTWRVALARRIKKGAKAGRIAGGGHRQIQISGERYQAHWLAWFYVTGKWPPDEVDHEDRNRDNNAWTNLRLATRKQNMENKDVYRNSTSGVRGVHWHNRSAKWYAQIGHNKRSIFLGSYPDFDSAVTARKAAEKLYFTHAPA